MIKVLVVEDSFVMRALVCRALQSDGLVPIEAEDGLDALDKLAEAGGVDLVVCDMHMPRMDGLELIAKLRASGYAQGIILLSAEEDLAEVRKARAAGATRWVAKPFDVPDLLHAVRSQLARAA